MAVFAFLNSTIGRVLVGAAVVLLLLGAVYAKGYANGKAVVQARWDAAKVAAVVRGANARTDAERSVDANGNPVGVPNNDEFDRDRGTM